MRISFCKHLVMHSLILIHRFGKCEPYNESMKVCDDIFTVGVDHVFVPRIHGAHSTQENISNFLNLTALQLQSSNCRNHVLQIICNYYLSPCGNKSFQVSPYSICPEDCNAVQKKCSVEWQIAQKELKDYEFINCNYTSTLLFPLKSCCKRVELQSQSSATPIIQPSATPIIQPSATPIIQPSATPIQPQVTPIQPSPLEGEKQPYTCNIKYWQD